MEEEKQNDVVEVPVEKIEKDVAENDKKEEKIEVKTEAKPEVKTEVTKPEPVKLDPVIEVMDKLGKVLDHITNPKPPAPKPKRKMSEKQLENLAKARDKRNALMAKRREIKKTMKQEDNKLVEKKLKGDDNLPGKSLEEIEHEKKKVNDRLKAELAKENKLTEKKMTWADEMEEEVVPEVKPVEKKKPAFTFASRPYRRR